jgi:tetratricopeptide (TPR) repeat protein
MHSAYWIELSRAHVVLKKISQASAKAAPDPIDIDPIKSCYQDVANESDESVAAVRKALAVAAPAERDDCRDNLTNALGNASYDLLFSGGYAEAQRAAEEALKNDPQKFWIYANQAHVLLLSGHYAEARAIYSRYGSKLAFSDANQTFAEAVKNDFQEFEMFHFLFTAEQLVNIQKMRDKLTSSGWRPSMDQAQKDTE